MGSFAVDSGVVGAIIFVGMGLFPGLCSVILAAQAQQHTRHDGQSDFQSTSCREGPPKNNSRIIKTQLHPARKHKWHKGHPKSIKFYIKITSPLNLIGLLP